MTNRFLRSNFASVAIVIALLAASACGGSDSPTDPSQVNVPYSQTDLVVGTGAQAASLSRVTTTYSGWLYDASKPENKGTLIDGPNSTISFTLGVDPIIQGWVVGITGMRVGGQRRLVIPPSLAYGSSGRGAVPPNATLVFDITLTNVQ